MKQIHLFHPSRKLSGKIVLDGSKSISNRVLIIKALCEQDFEITNLSTSDDTKTLQELLSSDKEELDAHHAGTTFRFLTSYLAFANRKVILTGSQRMKERPIGPLVKALNELGASISPLEKEGYPPLQFNPVNKPSKSEISLPANISSQYISSLLLIAPTLPNGLTINLVGEIVSRPYLEMTLAIMGYFGIKYSWKGNSIHVSNQKYIAKDFYVEADWSAASYYFSLAFISDECDITLEGLQENSLQGDQEIVTISDQLGIKTVYSDNDVRIVKKENKEVDFFEYNFLTCPDIAQTVSVMLAGRNISGLLSGLQTLKIKETDRIKALQTELTKVGVYLSKLPEKFSKKSGVEYYMQEGKARSKSDFLEFDTYKDHRMAMAFAPLALLFPLRINDPMVVTKSYANYYKDLQSLGFEVEEIS